MRFFESLKTQKISKIEKKIKNIRKGKKKKVPEKRKIILCLTSED